MKASIFYIVLIASTLVATGLAYYHQPIMLKRGKISFPENMQKITLAVTNHARTSNTVKIVDRAVRYDIVDEIIVWDDPIDPEKPVYFNHSKISVIRASEFRPMKKWGLLGRFKWALLARNENILIQDDDQLLYESAIVRMLEAKNEDPDRLVCYFGREIVDATGAITYLTRKARAPSHPPICLTKSVLTDRRFCLETVRLAPIIDDFAARGTPYWNGEDIWHSLVALKTTGKLHTVLVINYKEYKLLPSPHGISDNKQFNHTLFRIAFTQEAVRMLGLTADVMRTQYAKNITPS